MTGGLISGGTRVGGLSGTRKEGRTCQSAQAGWVHVE
jgi:hypothetical protein